MRAPAVDARHGLEDLAPKAIREACTEGKRDCGEYGAQDQSAEREARFEARRAIKKFRTIAAIEGSFHGQPDALPMGMSGDYAHAIAERATHVRVGTAIFGTRPRR